jgi:hypothetical protein
MHSIFMKLLINVIVGDFFLNTLCMLHGMVKINLIVWALNNTKCLNHGQVVGN